MSYKVAIPIVDRANYARLTTVIEAFYYNHREIEPYIIGAGSTVLRRFGFGVDKVPHERLYFEVEGDTHGSMTRSIGHAVVEFAGSFERINPNIVLLIGDRFEMLGAAIAAAYQGIPIAHIQGGELSGSLDDKTRNVISDLANYHFPSTRRAAARLITRGERKDRVWRTGCPSADLVNELLTTNTEAEIRLKAIEAINLEGSGRGEFKMDSPYVVVQLHPDTEAENPTAEFELVRNFLDHIRKPTLVMWPNIDPGSGDISREIRAWIRDLPFPVRTAVNFTPLTYLAIMAASEVLIGNSSAFVRDASLIGAPAILIGHRQDSREKGNNIITFDPDDSLLDAYLRRHQFRKPSTIYGVPGRMVGAEIAERLRRILVAGPQAAKSHAAPWLKPDINF